MFERLEKLINFVEKNDSMQLRSLLIAELLLSKRMPLKYIAGALVIAAEKNSGACFDTILEYNSRLDKQIPSRFIKAAFSMFPTNEMEMLSYGHLRNYEVTVH